MITSKVEINVPEEDARFPWILTIRGVPSECEELLWEQFVTGGFTITFDQGIPKTYSAVALMHKVNSQARQFGPWSDDMLEKMKPGPRPLGEYPWASCHGGVFRRQPNPFASMRGPSARPGGGAVYRFEDAPGFSKNFGDSIDGRTFIGITWNTQFEHKLWLQGEKQPLYRCSFSLTGTFSQEGGDTRKITESR